MYATSEYAFLICPPFHRLNGTDVLRCIDLLTKYQKGDSNGLPTPKAALESVDTYYWGLVEPIKRHLKPLFEAKVGGYHMDVELNDLGFEQIYLLATKEENQYKPTKWVDGNDNTYIPSLR